MVVLVVLLVVLLNLGLGQTQTPSDTSASNIENLLKQYREAIDKIRITYRLDKDQACKQVIEGTTDVARRHGLLVIDNGRAYVKLSDKEGFEYYELDGNSCRIITYEVKGTISPPSPISLVPIGKQVLEKQDIKFGVDVNLFRVLFQLLMYGAGIFWAVRAVQRFVAGELSGFFITLFIGFIIVASMYVLYKGMRD